MVVAMVVVAMVVVAMGAAMAVVAMVVVAMGAAMAVAMEDLLTMGLSALRFAGAVSMRSAALRVTHVVSSQIAGSISPM
jgi:hypothetical protein